jgi:dTDP-4-amino-4,6-dideoxygalactose transaminase
MTAASVPFVDLKQQYQAIKSEISEAINRVLDNSVFVLGREVSEFEEQFAAYTGARHCIAVNSGTAAIQLAVQASEIGPGDEVIVPANSFFASAEGVSTAGATPVFIDVEHDSYNLDATRLDALIGPHTKALMPVHLYGQSADLDPIFEVARSRGLLVIEDAAQAHGAKYKGKHVGALGHVGCFSFYPGKNLGAYGEGGAIVTNDDEVARRARLLRDHGSDRKYHHEMVGYNFRLEALQGAVLKVKLRYLDQWNELRRQHAAAYNQLLRGSGLLLPQEMEYAHHVYHLYVVQTDVRDELQQALAADNIQTGIHYPIPIHLQPAYVSHGHKPGDFPMTESQAQRVLSLPMFPELARTQIEAVAAAVSKFSARTVLSSERGA